MAKRNRTWGNITKQRNGVYRLRYPLTDDPITGERRTASETFYGTKKEAEDRLAELRLKFARKKDVSRNITVEVFWERYYHPYIKKNLAPSTVQGYESAYKCHIKPMWGKKAMEEIPVADVKEWLSNLTYGAAKKQLSTMRAMFNYAEDEELIKRNVMDRRFRLPNKNTARKSNNEKYNKEILDLIFNDIKGEYWEAGFITSAFGGLRREESFGVKKDEIIFCDDYAMVPVVRTVQRIKGQLIVSDEIEEGPETKTPESKRWAVIINPYAKRLEEILSDPEHKNDIWMLDDGFGRPIDPERAAASYKRWFMYHPYVYIPWKNLRKSYGTMLQVHHVPIEATAKILGHTNINTTYTYYDDPDVEYFSELIKKALS